MLEETYRIQNCKKNRIPIMEKCILTLSEITHTKRLRWFLTLLILSKSQLLDADSLNHRKHAVPRMLVERRCSKDLSRLNELVLLLSYALKKESRKSGDTVFLCYHL